MRPNPLLLTQRIIWFALLSASILYMVIAFVLVKRPPLLEPPNPIMPLVFGIVAISVTAASFFVPRIVYAQTVQKMNVETKEEAAPNAFPEGYRDALPKRIVFADPQAAIGTALICWQTPLIISLALSEAVALFGFVLAQLGFAPMYTLPFFLAGAVLIAIRFPRLPQIRAMFEKARGASFPVSNS